MPKAKEKDNTIARNKRARHDYFIEEEYEAGIALEGWEVKSLREGRAQLQESYVILRQGEVFLFGAHFSPLNSASTHVTADPTRTRKLLLHAKEIGRLRGAAEEALELSKGFRALVLWKIKRDGVVHQHRDPCIRQAAPGGHHPFGQVGMAGVAIERTGRKMSAQYCPQPPGQGARQGCAA